MRLDLTKRMRLRVRLAWPHPGWPRLRRLHLHWPRLGWLRLHWPRLRWLHPHWPHLPRLRPHWLRLPWPRLHWLHPRWPRLRWQWALVGVGVVAVGVVAALPVVSGRTAPRAYQLDAAKHALAQAQAVGAARWAPAALRRAESVFRGGLFEHRHQETRFLLFRDFTSAELILKVAETTAREASQEAIDRKRQASAAAQDAIQQAAEATGRTEAFARVMPLGWYDRSLLQKSKIILAEAKYLHAKGEYLAADQRATQAVTQADRVSDRAAAKAARYTDARLVRNWRQWIAETVGWSHRTGRPAIVVFKEKHLLTIFVRGVPVRSYPAELGANTASDKLRSGDLATPEGRYRITARKGAGMSTYYKALLLDYPNEEDRRRIAQARRAGALPRSAPLGGLIEIHGEGGRGKDWTNGCVALSNSDMDNVYDRVEVGTPVTIVGGDGNGGTFTKLVADHRAAPNGRLD